MTTVIRSSTSVFDVENVLQFGGFVRDGLVAAFRPSSGQGGLIDLSGHGHILTKIGSPTLTSKEMVGDSVNGYMTDIYETPNLTYIAVYKVLPTGGSYSAHAITCFRSPKYGSSIYAGNAGLRASTSIKETSTGTDELLAKDVGYSDMEKYVFVAYVVNSETGVVTTYAPAIGPAINTPQGDGWSIANRSLSQAKVSLAYNASLSSWLGTSHIAEALIYNKALTAEQIMQQYYYSKGFMASRGIAI